MTQANKFERISKFCSNEKRNDGSYFIKEITKKEVWIREFGRFEKESETIAELTPEQCGLTKKAEITVLFCKDYENRNEWNSFERVWFSQRLTYTMRSDCPNLFFKPSDGRLFIKDMEECGTTVEVALNESNGNYLCKADKPQKISTEQATELVKATGSKYIFSKVETNPNSSGNGSDISAYIKCV